MRTFVQKNQETSKLLLILMVEKSTLVENPLVFKKKKLKLKSFVCKEK